MARPKPVFSIDSARNNWLRLRTLILLRWLAISGQIVTIFVATQYFGLRLDMGLPLATIGLSLTANIVAIALFPENRRLSDTEAMLTLLFDISQLVLLLFLTGGLHNPFALLILAPVTISATALRLQSTLFLGGIAVFLISVLVFFHAPLVSASGVILEQPPLFLFGFWLALVIGIIFVAAYAWRVSSENNSMSLALLATQMALSREQKLTDLGGVIAAAAHELGTPLATIKLVSSELIDDLKDMPALAEDAALIRQQADRCGVILHSMGQAGKDDLLMRHSPLSAVIEEAAEPHMDRGIDIRFTYQGSIVQLAEQPIIRRQPEIIHGIRNLVQNAVDFANSHVEVRASWNDERIKLHISDDGKGYPPHLIGRIGDPFIRARSSETQDPERPEYSGMGLGLFIAKTLLERTGAEVLFSNGVAAEFSDFSVGAMVDVSWPRVQISQNEDSANLPLGENQLIVE